MMKFNKEFRLAHPETIGEKDSEFDMMNYAEWLEKELDKKNNLLQAGNYTILPTKMYEKLVSDNKTSNESDLICCADCVSFNGGECENVTPCVNYSEYIQQT